MTPNLDPRCRRGASLVELMVSMAAATALMAGIASTLYVASRASDPRTTPAISILDSASYIADMTADLQYALSISSATATGLTFTVPDRNSDAAVETIIYAWAGAGQPVTRRYNGGAVAAMGPSLQSFVIEYQPTAVAPQYLVLRLQGSTLSSSMVESYVRTYNLP